MLEERGEDLFKRALTIAEPEAVLGRDGVELLVCELSDLGEVLACGCQPTRDLRGLDGLGCVSGLVAVTIGLVPVLA